MLKNGVLIYILNTQRNLRQTLMSHTYLMDGLFIVLREVAITKVYLECVEYLFEVPIWMKCYMESVFALPCQNNNLRIDSMAFIQKEQYPMKS